MYCPKCGKKIDNPENTKFCPNCGMSIAVSTRPESMKKPMNASGTQPSRVEWASIIKHPINIIAAVLMVIALIAVLWGSAIINVKKADRLEQEKAQRALNEMFNSGSYTANPLPDMPEETEPATTSSSEIDPDYYIQGFDVYMLRTIAEDNIFSFIDEYKGERILVEGNVYNMVSSADERYIEIRPYNYEGDNFDYGFYVKCYLEGNGGEMTQYIEGNDYCFITGEIDPDRCGSGYIYLKQCYVYSVE